MKGIVFVPVETNLPLEDLKQRVRSVLSGLVMTTVGEIMVMEQRGPVSPLSKLHPNMDYIGLVRQVASLDEAHSLLMLACVVSNLRTHGMSLDDISTIMREGERRFRGGGA